LDIVTPVNDFCKNKNKTDDRGSKIVTIDINNTIAFFEANGNNAKWL
jgi:hypothetical protein